MVSPNVRDHPIGLSDYFGFFFHVFSNEYLIPWVHDGSIVRSTEVIKHSTKQIDGRRMMRAAVAMFLAQFKSNKLLFVRVQCRGWHVARSLLKHVTEKGLSSHRVFPLVPK